MRSPTAARSSRSRTRSRHPSQPNYLALFSGSTQNLTDNSCPHTLAGDNLANSLLRAGLTFGIYSESMPSAGYTGCVYGHYQRKHNPAVNWQGVNVPPSANQPFANFPQDFSKLPTVAMVVPNQENDMHNGGELDAILRGDAWLRTHLDAVRALGADPQQPADRDVGRG